MLLSASNSWFPLVFNTLSIPDAVDELGQLIEAAWHELSDIAECPGYRVPCGARQILERLRLYI